MKVHMTGDPAKKSWWDGKRHIPFSEMTVEQLRKLKHNIQRKELVHFNKCCHFNELAENIDKEAESRGTRIRDYKSHFHRNNRKLKQAT